MCVCMRIRVFCSESILACNALSFPGRGFRQAVPEEAAAVSANTQADTHLRWLLDAHALCALSRRQIVRVLG